MKQKLIPLIAIAFVAAVVATAVFYSVFASRLNGEPAANKARSRIAVAARDLPAGTLLSEADVSAVPWVNDGQTAGSFVDPAVAIGKTIFEPVARGEPILVSKLLNKDGGAVGVPKGMRAVSVHVSDSSGVVALLKPGFKVDVQVFESRTQGSGYSGFRMLLRGLTVLSVSTAPEPSSQGYFNAPVVTLLTNAADTLELAKADSFARLRIALRNPLEPVEDVVASQKNPGQAKVETARVRVETLDVNDEGLALLRERLDAGIGNRLSVGTAARDRVKDAAAALATQAWSQHSDLTIRASLGRMTYFSIGQQPRNRIGLMVQGGSRFRIRPEMTTVSEGRSETRSVESELRLVPGSMVVVSGLSSGGTFRHRVLLIEPAS